MPYLDVPGFPGMRATRTASYRRILKQGEFTFLARGVGISAANSRDPLNTGDVNVLRAGLIMGKRTSDGLYAPSIMGTLVSGGTVGSTALTVSAATATELNRRVGGSGTFKMVGPAVAGGVVLFETVTYSAVNTTTGVITCTATVNAYIAGSFVQAIDGSEKPLSFLPDGYGIDIFDIDGNQINQEWPQVPIAGVVDEGQLINYPTDLSLRAWLQARLNDLPGGQFVFGQNAY